jgi:hypothetical protein
MVAQKPPRVQQRSTQPPAIRQVIAQTATHPMIGRNALTSTACLLSHARSKKDWSLSATHGRRPRR